MSSSRASSTAAVQTTVRYRYVLNRVRRRPVASRARERDCNIIIVRPFYAHSITRTDADARGDASRSQSRDPGGDLPRSRMKKAARRNNEEMAGSRRNTNRAAQSERRTAAYRRYSELIWLEAVLSLCICHQSALALRRRASTVAARLRTWAAKMWDASVGTSAAHPAASLCYVKRPLCPRAR